jgi:hypothetical protein
VVGRQVHHELVTDVLEKHPKSTRFLQGYWRRRDDAPAAAEQHDRRAPAITFVVLVGCCVTVRRLALQRSRRVIVDKLSTNP